MKDTRCELVRRELEELTLNEDFSATAAQHLQACADCSEFQRQQTKLRQIVGSLGTVSAPADFDFRLRARLAADSPASSFRYWSFAVKGLATAAILVVFGVGVAVLWQRGAQQGPVAEVPRTESPAEPKSGPKQPDVPKVVSSSGPQVVPTVAVNIEPKRRVERPVVAKAKRSLTSVDFSSERATVVSNTRPVLNNEPVFPIDASLQSLKVSLDDGRGNARTISFPSVSFGSQRVLTNANQFNPKGVW
ncbi:MAG TPA: hypothetical protein VGK82_03845 [Pyrinomonadaceae bacterium]